MFSRTGLAAPMPRPAHTLIGVLAGALAILAAPAAAMQYENFKFVPGDGVAGQEFGYSVAVDNGRVAVGARFDDDNGANAGSAYVLDAATGAQITKLLATDGAAGDQFGVSIDIDKGLVAVGAWRAEEGGIGSGKAYVFDASTGAQLHDLVPADGAIGDEFGAAIAIDNGIVAVGSPRRDDNGTDSGSIYLFDAATGAPIDKLMPNDGGLNNTFGEAVAMDNGVIAVGAHGHSHNGVLLFPGAAYLFDVATGLQIAELVASDAQSWDFFGSAIAIDNGIVAVGAWAKNIVFDHSGAAYVFDAASGSQVGSLLVPADTRDRQHFGISVAVDDGVVAVGAEGDIDSGFEAGAAYLYDALSGSQIDKLLASDGAVFDRLGGSIAMDNGVVAVGAIGADAVAGSVYLYGSLPEPDSDGDGLLDVVETGTGVFVSASDTGSDPLNPDSDGDGLGDGFEVAQGSDPNVASSVACEVAMSQASYVDGEDVVITSLRFQNLSATPVPVRLRLRLALPNSLVIDAIDTGSGGGFSLPVGFDNQFGPITMFTLQPGQPRGNFVWTCSLEDPVGGQFLAEDPAPFEFQ